MNIMNFKKIISLAILATSLASCSSKSSGGSAPGTTNPEKTGPFNALSRACYRELQNNGFGLCREYSKDKYSDQDVDADCQNLQGQVVNQCPANGRLFICRFVADKVVENVYSDPQNTAALKKECENQGGTVQ